MVKLIGLVLPRNLSDAYKAIINLENQLQRQNPIFIGCYFVAKNRYAQELQYIFLMGE